MTFTLEDVNNIEFNEEISEADYYASIAIIFARKSSFSC